nr:MAG TPA: hypothetical protein [Caudoviricetes sp.]
MIISELAHKKEVKSVYLNATFQSEFQTLKSACPIYFFYGKTFVGKCRYSLGKSNGK